MASYDISSDTELKSSVRDETSYEDTADELDDSQLSGLIENAKRRVHLETGADQWYSDRGLGHALFAYTCMRAKAAMENASIIGYTLGDQQVQLRNADPDTSQQIQLWADDVRAGLERSNVDMGTSMTMQNTADYIGEQYSR